MTHAPKLTAEELERLLSPEFPRLFHPETGIAILKVWDRGSLVRQGFHPRSLRPGGTISGASMMMLADFTMYVAVLAAIGWAPQAVTTNLNINFLSKPAPRALEAECRLIKLGRRLAVGDIGIRSEGASDLVAHATTTYAIPAKS
ncbi:MAG TPA: PaaI family thioesterase [Xanthobacteraceae bacterium]|nr:PaaI family thioesterase [Xanthobacteraceae bacterium]